MFLSDTHQVTKPHSREAVDGKSRLLVFAIGNLLATTLLSMLSLAGVLPFKINGTWLAQAMVLGLIADLIPARGFVGLAWVIAYALMHFATTWLLIQWRGPAQWDHGLLITTISYGLFALMAVIVLLPLRIMAGWRIKHRSTELPQQWKAQFDLAELMGWTACIVFAFGCNHALGRNGARSPNDLVIYAQMFLPAILIAAPAAKIVLAQSQPSGFSILALVVWSFIVFVATYWTVALRLGNMRFLTRMWLGELKYVGSFMTVLFINLLILRAMGYRWRRREKRRMPEP